jgi:hypothetical protein
MLRETATEEGEEKQWYEEGIQETFVQSHPTVVHRWFSSVSPRPTTLV